MPIPQDWMLSTAHIIVAAMLRIRLSAEDIAQFIADGCPKLVNQEGREVKMSDQTFNSVLFMAIEDAIRPYKSDIPRMSGGDNCIQHAIFQAVKRVYASQPNEVEIARLVEAARHALDDDYEWIVAKVELRSVLALPCFSQYRKGK